MKLGIRGLSMDHEAAASSSTTVHLGCGGSSSSGRAIDRHNPIIRDATRLGKVLLTTTPPPCFSSDDDQPPINNIPKPHHHKNSRKNKSLKENTPNHHQSKKIISNDDNDDVKRKSTTTDHRINSIIRKSSWSCTKPAAADFVSPPGSSRYLLSTTHDHKSFLSDFAPPEPNSKISQAANITNKDDHHHHPSSFSSASIPTDNSSSSSPPDQVIVLSVSLHCKGCERKMKKRLSKMEGVTSFDIDFKAKKLTVVGDVTPLALLASVSKVKNAQLLTRPVASSIPSVCSNVSETKEERGIVV